ncbi:uncharacterized protein LOC125940617 [Dermacentor silvarum]|uniref:uncharacterized protein LOC125940617 n=1 Tax=Dermacentor silvarum TaxID=543639 RepID=UPI002101D279|nr:uncharacterized protein LOC125940617 [Dermacentor silvarum]XP_049512966.1 uncharacterized protein LOC125940617 [Dermacentor silvarum]
MLPHRDSLNGARLAGDRLRAGHLAFLFHDVVGRHRAGGHSGGCKWWRPLAPAPRPPAFKSMPATLRLRGHTVTVSTVRVLLEIVCELATSPSCSTMSWGGTALVVTVVAASGGADLPRPFVHLIRGYGRRQTECKKTTFVFTLTKDSQACFIQTET